MRIPTEWLKDYVDAGLSASELAELLVRLGLEIEEIVPAPEALGGEVLVAEITPNRGDCLSMIGIATEIAAATGAELRLPQPRIEREAGESIDGRILIRIDDPDLCPRYSARLVRGVTAGPSPEWMRQRLLACGQRPLDILIDVTNYVMFELGQPLHAFDHQLLGDTIVVRRARDREVLVTLDGAKRTLTADELLITDGERGVALAGVMGGQNTEVNETTKDVLLEGAHFYGPNIRRTSRRHALQSESSYRFARTVDPNVTITAINRTAELLAAHAGGTVAPGVIDVKEREFEPARITLRPSRCNSFLGIDLSADQMADHLRALTFGVEPEDGNLTVTVPTRRPDIEREVDLIEEIARLHGYDNVPSTIPPAARCTGRLTPRQRLERRVRELLLGCGLTEVWTFSLTSPPAMAKARMQADLEQIGAVVLENALNEEYSVMRWSMLPSLLEVIARNGAVHTDPVRIFEIGRTYAGHDSSVSDEGARAAGRVATGRTATELPVPAVEERTVGGAITGRAYSGDWNLGEAALEPDFYEVKGILELLLAELQIDGIEIRRCDEPIFAPGRAAKLLRDGTTFAVLGEVADAVLAAYDIRTRAVLFEANLGWLLEQAETRRVYEPLPRQPAALRDLALLVSNDTAEILIEQTIRAAAGEWLEDLRLFDVYRGKGIPSGQRSLAYNLRFRHPARTLTDDEVDRQIAAVIDAVGRELGASLRE